MGAEQLKAWEAVLTSPVAVSLLLLGAVFALGGVLLLWIRGLVAENRRLHGWIREHLEAEAGVSRVLDDLYPLLELIRDGRNAPGQAHVVAAARRPDRVASPPASARAEAGAAAPGDGSAPPVPASGP